jgi:hypothetical protein
VLARLHPPDLNHDALAEAMEDAMGAAVVNGAVKGALKRRLKWNGIQPQMNADGRRFFGSVPRFPSASICVYLRLTNCNRTQVSPGIEP